MIKQETIQQIFEVSQVEEVIQDYVNLKKRGINMIGLCPFHNEKTPSFTVSPSKNIYKCFGCGKGGNAVQFLMEHEKLSYPEALRMLAKKYNIPIEEKEISPEERASLQEKDSLFIINNFAKDVFVKNLFETEEGQSIGLSYFKERGYRESIIRKFELGFALRSRSAFSEMATKKGYNPELMQKLGLLTKNKSDFFAGRVIFPFFNLSGKVIGFGGRSLSNDKRSPKYLNSPESELFNKRETLYGAYFAKNAIRNQDECILVEGYTDVLSLHQSGIENAVASSGTSLTIQQIRIVKRFTDNIKIIYDGDQAGVKAALRGLDMVLEQNMNVRLVLLPEGEDPDSYLRKIGQDAFKTYLNEASEDFIFFKLKTLLKDSKNDPIKRSQVARDIINSLANIPDTLKRSMYIQECSQQLNIDESILINQTNKRIKEMIKKRRLENKIADRREELELIETRKKEATQEQSAISDFKGNDHQERDIIRILLRYGNQFYDEDETATVSDYILSNLSDVLDQFDNPNYQSIINHYIKAQNDGAIISSDHFVAHSSETIRNLAIELLAEPFEYSENWEKRWHMILATQKKPELNYVNDSYQAVLRFKLRKFNQQINSIQKQLNEANSEDAEMNLKILNSLIQMRNEIAKNLRTIVLK